jgi:tripartite-type tricarboxylate transporter receptor subunit TctC
LRQPADGYTLLHVAQTHALNPSFMPRLPYDPIKDFAPITHAVSTIFVMAIKPSVPANSIQEFIALARANPGKFTYASVGAGSSHHLGGAMLESMAGIKMLHVPFKGGSEVVQGLLSGEIDATFISVFPVAKFIQAGKLRGLAVTTTFRSPLVPNVPTMEEGAGLKGYDMDVWQGVMAKAGTPRAIINRLNREINAIVQDKSESQRLRDVGYEPAGNSPEQFTEMIKSEISKWSKLIKESGIRAE